MGGGEELEPKALKRLIGFKNKILKMGFPWRFSVSRLCASKAGVCVDTGSIPGRGTKIPNATGHGCKAKEQTKNLKM